MPRNNFSSVIDLDTMLTPIESRPARRDSLVQAASPCAPSIVQSAPPSTPRPQHARGADASRFAPTQYFNPFTPSADYGSHDTPTAFPILATPPVDSAGYVACDSPSPCSRSSAGRLPLDHAHYSDSDSCQSLIYPTPPRFSPASYKHDIIRDQTASVGKSTVSSDHSQSSGFDLFRINFDQEPPSTVDVKSNDPCYAELLWTCLYDAPNHRRALPDIYEWMTLHSAKAADAKSRGWMNSVRHNLSMNAGFMKVDSGSAKVSKKASMWCLTPEAVVNGIRSTTRYRRKDKPRALRHGFGPSRNATPGVTISHRGTGQACDVSYPVPDVGLHSPVLDSLYLDQAGLTQTHNPYIARCGEIGPQTLSAIEYSNASMSMSTMSAMGQYGGAIHPYHDMSSDESLSRDPVFNMHPTHASAQHGPFGVSGCPTHVIDHLEEDSLGSRSISNHDYLLDAPLGFPFQSLTPVRSDFTLTSDTAPHFAPC